MATDIERNCFADRLLSAVAANRAELEEEEITGFLSMMGRCYSRELMVVGRSVNGWTSGIRLDELAVPKASAAYAAKVFESVTSSNERCPMMWVSEGWGNPEDYNTRRSAFWRVIRAVVEGLGIANADEPTWPSHLVWSNLYKVSPSEGGNPSTALCRAQQESCISLLRLELSVYLPRRLLLLTGMDWATPFLDELADGVNLSVNTHYVEAVGCMRLNGEDQTKVVVARHPQGKPEEAWVSEVLGAMETQTPLPAEKKMVLRPEH